MLTFSSYSLKPSEGASASFARLRLRVLHVTHANGQCSPITHRPFRAPLKHAHRSLWET